MSKIKVLVVIPCFNEVESIGAVIDSIKAIRSSVFETKILLIDDGSSDKSHEIALHKNVLLIRHHRNLGLGAVFRTMCEFVLSYKCDSIVTIDGDGQFDGSQVSALVKMSSESGADIVIGSRFTTGKPKSQPLKNYLGNLLANYLTFFVTQKRTTDVSSGFRIYRKEALLCMDSSQNFNFSQYTFLLASYLDMYVCEIPVQVQYFDDRISRMAPNFKVFGFRVAKNTLSAIRELYPKKYFNFIAFLFLIPSFIFGFIFIVHFFNTGRFSGYLFAGFGSGFFFFLTLILWISGLITNSLNHIKRDQIRLKRFLYQTQNQGKS
jgi:glycosyltransferase involved in cell wall biosynthesis